MKKIIVFLAFLSLGLFAVLESQTVNATIGTSSGTPVATCSFRVLGLDITSSSLWMCNANVWFRPWAAPGPPSVGDQVAISSASGTAAWKQVASGADCGATDTTHALNYTHSTNTIGCVAITGGGGVTTSGFQLFDGTHYFNWPPSFQDTVPSAASFSWVNQGSATETASGGQLYLHCPDGDAGGNRVRVTSIGTNTTAIGAIVPVIWGGGAAGVNPIIGLVFYESATQKLTTFIYGWDNGTQQQIGVWSWTAPATFGVDIIHATLGGFFPYVLMKIQLSGANLVYSYSFDGGANYTQILSEAKTARFTTGPDNWGYFCNASGVHGAVALTSWAVQ